VVMGVMVAQCLGEDMVAQWLGWHSG